MKRSLPAALWFVAFALSARAAITDGLVAHWSFDETNGLTAADSTTNANHGALNNFPANNSQWAAGKIGGALTFRGPGFNDYVRAPNYPKPAGAATLSAWVWADARPTWASIVKNWSSGGGQFHFGLQDSAGDLSNYLTVSGGGQPNTRENVAFPLGSWQHVAFTADGATMRIFHNGVQVANVNYSGNLLAPPVSALGIGVKLNDAGTAPDPGAPGYWQGRMDDIGLWNRALPAADIAAIYNAGLNGQDLTQATPSNLGGGEVIITELMAVNAGVLRDEDGDSPDWIELYNGAGTNVDLAGWFLTDTAANLRKWQFPSTPLAANAYLVVFASSKNRRTSGTTLHTNFKLASGGGYLALVKPDGMSVAWQYTPVYRPQVANVSYGVARLTSPVLLMTTGSVARVLVPTDGSLGTNWIARDFDDSGWIQGTNGVGYENSPGDAINYTTMVRTSIGNQMFNLNGSCYIRFPFVVADPAQFTGWKLRLQYDDGFVAWLNGEEIARANAPGSLAWDSVAPSENVDGVSVVPEVFDLSFFADEDLLKPGTNILAIQGLNVALSSSDFVILPVLEAQSLAAVASGLRYFTAPTPGAANVGGVEALGPILRNVTHTPARPADNDNILVNAQVTPSFNPIASVTLHWRVMYGPTNQLPMFDDGMHGDGAAGDTIYGATIPAGASTNGQMVRWYIRALDSTNTPSRDPLFLDPGGSPEYHGIVVLNPGVTSNLPILQWFVANPAAAETATGTRCSFSDYNGEFFDNVFVRIRGLTSRGFPKKSLKIDLNEGHHMLLHPGLSRINEVNLNTTYTDKSYVRAVLTSELDRRLGLATPEIFQVQLRQNNAFYSVALFVEQPGKDFLRRWGLDENGAYYKGVNGTMLDNTSGYVKKTRLNEGNGDLQALVNGLALTGTALENYLFDNVDVPVGINYMATVVITQNIDASNKNHYLHRDTLGTGEWKILPWDLDLTFGPNALNTDTIVYNQQDTNAPACASHPFIGARPYLLSSTKYLRLLEAFVNTPRTRAMLLRRTRTLTDQFLARGYFQQRLDQLVPLLSADVLLDKARWGANGNFPGTTYTLQQATDRIRNEYLTPRLPYLTGAGIAGVGAANPAAQPANASVRIATVEFNPSSGNQEQEFICLTNPHPFAVDLTGWRLDGEVGFTFAPGTVVPATHRLYLSPNVAAFRSRAISPRGGEGHFVQGNYQGKLSARGGLLQLVNRFGQPADSFTYTGAPSPSQLYLRVTELMYNPAPGPGSTNAQDFEYIELRNIGPASLDLTGIRFTNGVDFNFAGSAVTSLASGARVLVVKRLAAFTLRYGGGISIAGQFAGNLDNGGEKLRLEDASGEKILEFDYDNNWYPITDGQGFSLVIVDDAAPWDTWGQKASWRPGGQRNGAPGASDPPLPDLAPIVINEVLSRTDAPPPVDSIELFNPTATTVNVGGWFLSDDFSTPMKFRIPDETMIPAGGYVVFTESDFNPTPGVPPSFALGSGGDQVWLFSGDASTNLTGYEHGFDFGAAEEGVSFGRLIISTGDEHFVAQASFTPGAANSGPKVGPVVLSEIMFHPPDTGTDDNTLDEFIELHNASADPVPLFHASLPVNTWHLRGAVDFDFPTDVTIPAGGHLVVVSFDPAVELAALAVFRARYGLSPGVPILGPFSGKLDNSGGTVELHKTNPTPTNASPYILVERVAYRDSAPWTGGADGTGASLQRRVALAYGNDPSNWCAALPTPGGTYPGGTAPVIAAHPQSQTVLSPNPATFTVTSRGGRLPLTYQWRFNGVQLPGAIHTALTLTNVQLDNYGLYDVVVLNAAGFAFSSNALLTVLQPANITQQPTNVEIRVRPDTNMDVIFPTNASFTVIATTSNPPLTYQWRMNGTNLLPSPHYANINAATLIISNVTITDFGDYSCALTDLVGTIFSFPATLHTLVRPSILLPWPNQTQTVVAGSPFPVSAVLSNGWPPPFGYLWRHGSTTINSNSTTSSSKTNFYVYPKGAVPTGVVTGDLYRLIVTNRASTGFSVTVPFYVTTLLDTDHDGIPDSVESALGLDPNNSADAGLDADTDRMTNLEEYQAGTDPTNAASYLKIEHSILPGTAAPPGAATLWFAAVSNRTYAIQFNESLGATSWSNLVDIVALPTNRVEVLLDPGWTPHRFYRVVTPRLP